MASTISVNTPKRMYNYLFVFESPHTVTNVPIHELASQLRSKVNYSLVKKDDFSPHSFFHKSSIDDLRKTVSDIPDSKYGSAILYSLEQSCIVSTDKELGIKDLKNIVRDSGYIHSAGELLIAARWDSVSKAKIEEILKEESKSQTIGLNIWDEEHIPSKSLDGLAIDSDRYFIGHVKIATQAAQLQQKYSLHKAKETVTMLRDIHNNGDRSYNGSGDDVYMLAFAPQIKKYSPLQMLDESKPYWKGIDTTPQNLMAAMLNLVGLSKGKSYLDIFGGMGTSMIEATKANPLRAIHSDLNEIIGARDNFNFLTMNPDKMYQVIQDLKAMRSRDSELFNQIYYAAKDALNWDGVGITKAYPEVQSVDKLFKKYPMLEVMENRIMFYLLRRGFYREADLKGGIYDKFLSTISDLENYSMNMFKANSDFKNGERLKNGITHVASIPQHKGFEAVRNNVLKSGALWPGSSSLFDGIVSDPPYGYGTDADPSKIEKIYEKYLRHSFRLLKNGGGLSFCVLDKVRTGKPVNENLTASGIVDMVNRVAAEENVSIMSETLDSDNQVLYWKSRKKLNRGIVNLKVAKETKDVSEYDLNEEHKNIEDIFTNIEM